MIPNRVVAIGSSSLFGVGDSDGGGFIGRLKKWHEGIDIRNSVYNLGIPGDTTTGMLKRFSEVSIRKPNLILISSGLNDTRRIGKKNAPNTTPLPAFRNNIKALISEAREIADLVFISVYPIDEERTAPLTYWKKEYYYLFNDAKEYEAATKEICKQSNIAYVDNFSEWMAGDYKNWLFEDGLHANAQGHEKIFQGLKQRLEAMTI